MDEDMKQDDIVEGEVVGDQGDEVVKSREAKEDIGAAAAMMSLEELIKNHIESIDKLKLEIKQAREMLDDSFENNPTYREESSKVKEISKSRNAVRQQIAKQPAVAQLAQKVKDLRFDMSEQMKTLSDLLQDYHEQTGATQIEDRKGQVMEIVSTAKLVRRSGK